MPLDEAVAKVLKDNGLGNDAVWQHQQSKSWIMKHWACEHAAIKAGIIFDQPTVIDASAADKIAVICVTGRLGEHTEWSFGEAAPYNTKQSYPFAMAEKRAKDRVILKLLGVHGKVYSEEEADDFRAPDKPGDAVRRAVAEPKILDNAAEQKPLPEGVTMTALKAKAKELVREIFACTDMSQLIALHDSMEYRKPLLQMKEYYRDGYDAVLEAQGTAKTNLSQIGETLNAG